MDGQIQMAIYRIESIVNRVKEVVVELEKLHDKDSNLTAIQKRDLKKQITLLKEIR